MLNRGGYDLDGNIINNNGFYRHEGQIMCAEWEVTTREAKIIKDKEYTGEIISQSKAQNLVTNLGRNFLFGSAFCPASSGFSGFYYLAVGASAVAAQVTDTRLTYELIGNPTRKTVTDTSGNPPNTGDILTQTITVGGCTFYEYLVLQTTFLTTDGNNNNTFNEYGLFNTVALPSGPTGTSGVIFNHYIDPNPAFKAATNQVVVQLTLRL